MAGIIYGINNIFNLFYFLIMLRIFLSWIPSIDWGKNPWFTLRQVTDAYLNVFRRFIPPIGMVDWSPIIAIFALVFIQRLVITILLSIAGV
ncbi:YggT family protein [bacterium]|nr:YggT family protein [bacterium]